MYNEQYTDINTVITTDHVSMTRNTMNQRNTRGPLGYLANNQYEMKTPANIPNPPIPHTTRLPSISDMDPSFHSHYSPSYSNYNQESTSTHMPHPFRPYPDIHPDIPSHPNYIDPRYSADKKPRTRRLTKKKEKDTLAPITPVTLTPTATPPHSTEPACSPYEDPIFEAPIIPNSPTPSARTGTKPKRSRKTDALVDPLAKPKRKPAKKRNTADKHPQLKREEGEPPAKLSRKISHPPLAILDKNYALQYVLSGHIDVNPPVNLTRDDQDPPRDIWCCEFEPKRPGQVEDGNIVAIAGSYFVLLLDTFQYKFVKKYTHPEVQEIFYCMAWTTLRGGIDIQSEHIERGEGCNILAVAGRLGSIKLIDPLQSECYRYLFGHNRAVVKLTFSQSEPRYLFSASADMTVRLWDIGSLSRDRVDAVCLAQFNIPTRVGGPSAISVSYDLTSLMVGTENGNMLHFPLAAEAIREYRDKALNNMKKNMEKHKDSSGLNRHPGLSFKYDELYPHGEEWHEGYIDDIFILGQDGDPDAQRYNKIVSRGAEDMEIIVWDRLKSSKSDSDIITSFVWPDSADCTGLRFKVYESNGRKVLVAGNYEGQILIYDIGNAKTSRTLEDGSKELFGPLRVLAHKLSTQLIRDVSYSTDTSTLVAVDNNNSIFIWKAV
ncbi:WD40-repeat-containing domain protein [Pilobolus umbonatus]|nr:WD40-repeat-containing domain protein [Pilobolus umbonatus]